MDLREIYISGIEKFSFGPLPFRLLHKIMSGDDKTIDFEEIIESDAFFSKTILTEAFKLTHEPIRSLAQAVGIIGKDRVRNFVLAQSVNRVFDAKSDLNFKSITECIKILRCASESENLAKQFSIERPELGFSSGLVFDVMEQWLLSNPDLKKKFSGFFDNLWRHSLRTALISTSLSSRLMANITNHRLLYAAALLHDVGKLLLAFTHPENYQNLLSDFSRIQKMRPNDDNLQIEIERDALGISHSEAGSLLLWQFEPLKDWEGIVEYHHEPHLLKYRDPNLAKTEAILCVSDNIADFLETSSQISKEVIEEIIAPFQNFSYLRSYEILDSIQGLRSKTALL